MSGGKSGLPKIQGDNAKIKGEQVLYRVCWLSISGGANPLSGGGGRTLQIWNPYGVCANTLHRVTMHIYVQREYKWPLLWHHYKCLCLEQYTKVFVCSMHTILVLKTVWAGPIRWWKVSGLVGYSICLCGWVKLVDWSQSNNNAKFHQLAS